MNWFEILWIITGGCIALCALAIPICVIWDLPDENLASKLIQLFGVYTVILFLAMLIITWLNAMTGGKII